MVIKRAQYWNEWAPETWVDADYLLGILKDEHFWCDKKYLGSRWNNKLEGCKILLTDC